MFFDERIETVAQLIRRHVASPSLRHIRDPNTINRLAEDIVGEIDRKPSIWSKWGEQREALLKAASRTWAPVDELRHFLNAMPGPPLTLTDVQQRLRAFHEEPYEPYPNEDVREGCLALYEREKAAGTEVPAIILALQEYVEAEEERLRKQHEERWKRQREEERIALEQRFLAGADCKWTPLSRSKALFTRKNGRAHRLPSRAPEGIRCAFEASHAERSSPSPTRTDQPHPGRASPALEHIASVWTGERRLHC